MEVAGFKDPGRLSCEVTQGSETLGFLVIDSTIGNRAWGGLRMETDVDQMELSLLAQAMTLKFGFLGLPQGGAKAGVCCDPEAPAAERRQRLAAFAKALAPLLRQRLYQPSPDMGTDYQDINYLLAAAGVRTTGRASRSARSGYYTALSVFAGVKQALRFLETPQRGVTAAIEGFGRVGSPLAGLLVEAGLRVVAVSTSRGAIYREEGLDVGQLQALASQAGSRVVELFPGVQRLERRALLELPVDVLCPCARHHSLNQDNAPRVQARVISPGANNPLSPEAEQLLFERGVVSIPDFVSNSGGVLGGTMEFASVSPQGIAAFIDVKLGDRLAWLLQEAARQKSRPSQIAISLAQRRFAQIRRQAEHPSPRQRLFHLAVNLYRQKWVPGFLVAPLSLQYFSKNLA